MQGALPLSGFLGFASGILCSSLFVFSWHVPALLLVFAAGMLLTWKLRRNPLFVGTAIFLLCAVLGAVRVMLTPASLPSTFVSLLETEITLEGRVVAEPDIRETMQRITLEVEREGEKTNVLAVAPLFPEVSYGETIEVTGTLVLPEPFETDSGRTFRYDRFLAKDGIFALVEFAKLTSVSPPEGIRAQVMGSLLSLKHWFQDGLSYALPEPSASLASGLITGGKQGLGEELLDAFIIVGLVHIVVLSGYNVMIVAEAVLLLCGRLFSRRAAAVFAGVTVGLFVLAAGAGAASVRAGLMAGLALLARATGRTYAVVRALLVVAVLMLVANPFLLAYDPGFQLSFIATVGLILLSPVFERKLGFVKSAFWRDLLAATLAAQIAVLPLLLYQTGLFSFASLPANLLVLPLVPLAMGLSAIAGVAGMLVPAIAPYIGFPAHSALLYIVELARFSAGVPLASMYVPQFPFWITAVAYLGLGYVIAKAPPREGLTHT